MSTRGKEIASGRGRGAPDDGPGLAVCAVATVNHLHLVLNLARTIRATWSDQPAILIAVADADDGPRPGFEPLDVEFVDAATLGFDDYLWLAAKYDASDLCCAIKPFVVRHALARGHACVVYCDADLHFFGEPASLLELAAHHDFVVTPHTLAPFPAEEAWLRPTLGDLSGAGLLNAGLFAVRASAGVERFLESWCELVTAPGAFLPDLGGQHEQNFFAWVLAFADDVAICRDRTINVAYWNLHERPVRWSALDGGRDDEWRIDGEPLACFHYSGFAWDEGRLSKHDSRHVPSLDVNVHALCRYYAERLADAEEDVYAPKRYGFGEVDGHRVGGEVRLALKRAERFVAPLVRSWDEDFPELLRRLHGIVGPSHVVPSYLEQLLEHRPDLRALNAHDVVFPERLLTWTSTWFAQEYEHGWLFERHCDFAWDRGTVARIAGELRCADPSLDQEEATALVLRDRTRASDALDGRPGAASLLELLAGASYRFAAYDPALCLRLIYFSRGDLREAFPDPLGDDLPEFREWIDRHLAAEYALPEAVARFAAELEPEHAVARVLSFVRGSRDLHERLASLGLDRELVRGLVPAVASDSGVGASDLVLADWWLRSVPGRAPRAETPPPPRWLAGVRHALRLARASAASHAVAGFAAAAPVPAAAPAPPEHRQREAPLGGTTRATLLDGIVVREPGDPRFARYLEAWLERRDPTTSARRRARLAAATSDVVARLARPDGRAFAARATAALARIGERGVRRDLERWLAPDPRGVNVFGYFKSPIGLGSATLGVCRALEIAGYRHRDVVLSNMTMSRDLRLADLVPDFAFQFPRNLVVSYPHIQCDVFDVFPECFFAGRETIGYLAWEQRDLHPEWAARLARFDRMYALSGFAAESLARGVGRPVGVLPCVVEVDVERARSFTRADLGIPDDTFAVGFVFDASSSVERKNPLGAVRAIAGAFGGRRDVVAVLKITNGDRHPFTRMVDRVVAELRAAGVASVVFPHVLPRAQVEGLMASLDLYLSLHRSEGFGYTLAEAMLLGVPALATRYSGNLDFMTDENSWLVSCRETIVRRAEGPFRLGTVWADPDLDDAIAKCRRVYDDRDEARRRAERARRDVEALLSPRAVARRMVEILAQTR